MREQFALDTDTTHRDYLPSHIHRLVMCTVTDDMHVEDVTAYIDETLLDQIEAGELDDHALAIHNPTKENAP